MCVISAGWQEESWIVICQTPTLRFHKEQRDYSEFKFLPHDLGKVRKRKTNRNEEQGNTTPQKPQEQGNTTPQEQGNTITNVIIFLFFCPLIKIFFYEYNFFFLIYTYNIFFFPIGCTGVGGCPSPRACWAYPRAGPDSFLPSQLFFSLNKFIIINHLSYGRCQ